MTGTANQVDWAEQIKARVSAEFDRVARALASVANRQTEQDRMDTLAAIAILSLWMRRLIRTPAEPSLTATAERRPQPTS